LDSFVAALTPQGHWWGHA